MTPTVALAGPQETLAAVDPFDVAARDSRLVPIDVSPRDVDPRFVFLSQDRTNLARANVAKHDGVRILAAVELLNDDLVGVRGKFHARKIVVARVAGDFEPLRRTAVGAHNADARG